MKKWIALLLGICMMFLCVGCGAEMRLEPAQLTDEDRINPLLVQDGIIPGQVYAYHTSDRLESIRSVLYKLGIDGNCDSMDIEFPRTETRSCFQAGLIFLKVVVNPRKICRGSRQKFDMFAQHLCDIVLAVIPLVRNDLSLGDI